MKVTGALERKNSRYDVKIHFMHDEILKIKKYIYIIYSLWAHISVIPILDQRSSFAEDGNSYRNPQIVKILRISDM